MLDSILDPFFTFHEDLLLAGGMAKNRLLQGQDHTTFSWSFNEIAFPTLLDFFVLFYNGITVSLE